MVSGMAYESLFPARVGLPARVGRPSGGRNLLPQARADCRSSPVRFLTCCGGVGEHADATRPPQAGRSATALLPGWVLIVLVIGGVGVGGRGGPHGLMGWLSTAWLTVVPAAAASGASFFQLFANTIRALVGNGSS